MKFKIIAKIRILCCIFLLIFMPSTLFFIVNLTQIIAAFKGVVHISEQTIVESQGLAKLIVDMETGQRGFVITGEKEFLEPYNKANEAFDKKLAVLRAGLADQVVYLELLKKIENLRYEWIRVAGEPEIEARRSVKKAEVNLKLINAMFAKEKDRNILDDISITIEAMTQDFDRTGRKDELILITRINKDIVYAEFGERGYLQAGQQSFLESYYTGQIAFNNQVKELEAMLASDDINLQRLYLVKRRFDAWLAKVADPEILVRMQYEQNPRTMDDVISLLKAGTGKKIMDELRDVIQKFTDGLIKNIQHELFQAEKKATRLNMIILAVSSAGIFLSVFIAFWLGRSIINPIKVLTDGTQKIGKGNLEHKINLNTGDEFGILSDSFNKMTEDLKKSKEELITAKDYTDNIIKSIVDSLIIVDPDSKISMVNKATCDLLGYDAAELVGNDIGLLFPQEEGFEAGRKMFRGADFHELIERGFIKGLEGAYLTKTGNKVPTLFSGSVMRDEDGRIRGIICLASDITKLKQAEEAFHRSEEKLARSRKMESMGLLAGGVAHDLNNVLSGIVSYPDIILMDLPADSRLRQPIETMKKAGQRAAAIVQDLLTMARGVAIATEPLNLNDLIRDYLISPEFDKIKQFYPAVAVEADLNKDMSNVRGSRVHINKAIMNLVSNALEAIDGSGNVTISTVNRYVDRPVRGYYDVNIGEYAVLAVRDDGSGISSDDLERIFEPFYTKKAMGRSGTGLGLTVVWNLMQDHKGYIDITSGGNGTTFELYFPLTRDEISHKDLSQPVEDLKGNAETILVVDDVASQREISCQMLDILNYNAKSVSSGETAVEYLKAHSVDLLLLDMIMDPGINGRETYQRIIKIHPDQKAIIVSGFAETDEVRKAQSLGAGKFFKKPITLEKLGLAVKKELEK